MAVMGVVEMAVDEIVHVVAMRDGLVTAVGAVLVRRVVSRAGVVGGTADGIAVVGLEPMLLDLTLSGMMKMA